MSKKIKLSFSSYLLLHGYSAAAVSNVIPRVFYKVEKSCYFGKKSSRLSVRTFSAVG